IDPSPTDIYTLSLHDALPISQGVLDPFSAERGAQGAVRATFGYQGAFVDVQDIYFRINLATAQGNTTYEGGLQDGEGNHIPLTRSEEHTSELQSRENLVCRLL